MPTHPPAPTTYLYNPSQYKGDKFSCHSLTHGAKYACSIELSKRTIDTAQRFPGQVVLGLSNCQRMIRVPGYTGWTQEEAAKYIKFIDPGVVDGVPSCTSGLFALWFALYSGYDTVYTVGLDGIQITFTNGYDYSDSIVGAYMRQRERGVKDPAGYSMVDVHAKNDMYVEAANMVLKQFPDRKVYKVSDMSLLPVETRKP